MRPAVALVVLVAAALGGAVVTDGTPTNVAVTNVTVSPTNPVPGERITITPTIQNFGSSNETYVVDAVALRTGPGQDFDELTRVRDPGRISPGGSLQVPLSRSFSTTGTKEFRVVVYGETASGQDIQLTYPVTVRVTDAQPRVGLDVAETVEGTESNVTVTVANGLERDVRNVEVRLDGDVTARSPRQVSSLVGAGESAVFPFVVVPDGSGESRVTATVEYTLAGGPTRTVSVTETVETAPLEERVSLSAEVDGERVVVNATNLGNVAVERVVLGADGANATVGQAVISRLGPGETRRVQVPVRDVDGRADVTVRATYDIGDTSYTTAAEPVTVRANPGRIELTGVDARTEAGVLAISGSASNVGLAPVESVVVRVVERDGVTPVAPNREYFVGTVPASDFVSFDVTARVGPNVTSVPLEVTYLSAGAERVETVSVPVRDAAVETPQGGSTSGVGPLVAFAVGAVVVLGVAVAVFIGWRNRRGGD